MAMPYGVKCRFDNISERKANWYSIKSPLINIRDARLPNHFHENWSYFYDTVAKIKKINKYIF